MSPSLPTGTVTFLFTDIEGSTTLAQEFPDIWESLRRRHDAILRHAIESANGYVFRIVGDAFCAAFHTVGDALRAAIRSQISLADKSWEGPAIKVRMGIHTGKAELQEDGEYLGYLTLTRVQRVMSVAHGSQILLSSTAAELVHNELPEGIFLLDMREHRLKGLQKPERLWQVGVPGLPHEFPPLQSFSSIPNNLPVQLTSFIGREKEIATLKETLSNHRLITLTGPGGVGKTRLSIEAASELVNDFRNGVWFVDLAHVTDPALVAVTIARVLGVPEMPGRKMIDILKDYLRDKELLLVLDNFEQVVEASALAKELLVAAPEMKVMITSRTLLRVAGEHEYQVPLLPLPNHERPLTLERLAHMESVRLFVERAQAAKADFVLTGENAPAIAETCQRLDGLPLAIELAAARVRVLPPQKMISQLDNRLKFLTSAARDLPPRQQTLRAAIGWSYDLLTVTEQLLFRQLAVFMGGATMEAIEYVCSMDKLDILNHLESLLDKSLLRQVEQDDEPRYEMLETIRDFADEMLVLSGEEAQVQTRHLAYFHGLARAAEPNLVSPDEMEWIKRLTSEHDNLRAAVQWGLKNDLEKAVELLCDLTLFWSRAGHNEEVIGWLGLALSNPLLTAVDSPPRRYLRLRARALLALGILSLQQEYPEAPSTLREAVALLRQLDEKHDLALALAFVGFLGDLRAAQESVDIARTTDDPWLLAYSLVWQSQALRAGGDDLQRASQAAAEGAAWSRKLGSAWAMARSVFSQAQLAAALGDLAQARGHFHESMALFTQTQDKYHANLARTELAHVERMQGNYTEALELYKAALQVWHDLGLRAAVAHQFECLALIAAAQGNAEHSIRLQGAAKKLREQTKSHLAPNQQTADDNSQEAVRGEMETSRYQDLLLDGQSMPTSEAIAYAVGLPDGPAHPASD